MKKTKAHETNIKQTQINEVKLSSKPTSKGKRDRTKVSHKKGGHLQKQSNMASLKD
jgi:hypothetical protein